MELEPEKASVSGRVVGAVIIIIIIAAAATAGIFYYFKTGSTPSLGSLFSSGQAQTSNITSQSPQVTQPISIFGSPSYSLQVTKVTVAQAAPANGYILNVDAFYAGSGTWQVNPANFEVVAGNSAVYTLIPSNYMSGMTTPLSSVVLASGQHAVGQLGFRLPAGQTPMQLEYLNQSANINVRTQGIPQVSTYVCQEPDFQVVLSQTSVSAGVRYQPSPYQSVATYYLSGDQITVPILANVLGNPNQAGNSVIGITTNSTGVNIAQIHPSLPASVGYLGASLNVTIVTPSSACVRTLYLQVSIGKPPPTLTLTNVSFAATGTAGRVTISNSGTNQEAIVQGWLLYSGSGCGFGIAGSGPFVNPNSYIVFTWDYNNGSPCNGLAASPGGRFSGNLTFSDGEAVPFSGVFTAPVQTVTVTSGSAQVSITGTALLASNFLAGGSTKTFTCATTSAGSYLTLTNTGSGSVSVATISITWAGGTTSFTGPTNCNISASSSASAITYVIFPATSTITPSAISGQTYTGTVTLSNGIQLLFTGTWQ